MLFFVFSCRFLFSLLCYDYRQRQKCPSCDTSTFLHNGYRGSSSCGVKMRSHVNPMQNLFKRGNYTYTPPYFFTELCLIENRTKFAFSLLCNWEHTAIRSMKKTRDITSKIYEGVLKNKTSCCFP